jgi:agmatinase
VRRPALLGLPYDASSSYLRGAADGPRAIREALHCPSSNTWSEALQEIGSGALVDMGDLELPKDAAAARALIEERVATLLDEGRSTICLGGDHSVTYPILRAFGSRFPGLSVLHVDAHPDLYDAFQGDRYSHACPFARTMEERLVARLVQVGIRAMSGDQKAQVDRFGVEVFDMRAWERGARPSVEGPVYVTIDLDGIDPAFAPGVAHPEPGGLSTRDVIGLIQRLPGPVVGADVVELNPHRDPMDLTAGVAAKLVKELASRMLRIGA